MVLKLLRDQISNELLTVNIVNLVPPRDLDGESGSLMADWTYMKGRRLVEQAFRNYPHGKVLLFLMYFRHCKTCFALSFVKWNLG